MNNETQTVIVNTRDDARYIAWLASSLSHQHSEGCEDCRATNDEAWRDYLLASHAAAMSEEVERSHVLALADPQNERRATAEEVSDSKEEREVRTLGATPEQLARLRALVTSERDALRLSREVSTLQGRITSLLSDPIRGDDERIRPLLEEVAVKAEERGFCSEFDLVLDLIGSPWSRTELLPESEFEVEFIAEVRHTITVTARNREDAREKFDSMFSDRYEIGDEIGVNDNEEIVNYYVNSVTASDD